MPELPEVETIVRDLQPIIPGKTIVNVQVLRPNIIEGRADAFTSGLIGATFDSIYRRGKNIVAHMNTDCILAINLGMTGRLALDNGNFTLTHPAVYFQLDSGNSLIYDDVRRFGKLQIFGVTEWQEHSKILGPEPLSADYKNSDLYEKIAISSSPVRSWLLNQKNLAGVGNIYANEALHLSGIHPRRVSSNLTKTEVKQLHQALQDVLLSAILNRGTTLRNYRDASGRHGKNKSYLRVYGRHGQACFKCSRLVERIVFSNRSAFFCPGCQR